MINLLPTTVTTDDVLRDAKVAVLPVGSFEQHGPHLPLITDTLIAIAVADAIAQHHPVRTLPPLTISCSHEHAGFPGTVSISATTLAAIVLDIAESLREQGIHSLLLVNGHGGNYVLSNVVQQANLGTTRMALFPTRGDWDDTRHAAGMVTSSHADMHAGELEMSILLAAFPTFVRDGWKHDDHASGDRRELLTRGLGAYTTSGVIGRPSAATEAKGRTALQTLGELGGDRVKRLIEISNRP